MDQRYRASTRNLVHRPVACNSNLQRVVAENSALIPLARCPQVGVLQQRVLTVRFGFQVNGVKKQVESIESGNEIAEIRYTQFVSSDLNSLTWYDLLPGDPTVVTDIDDPRSAADVARHLMLVDLAENPGEIDLLAAKVLNGCDSVSDFDGWDELAFRLSRVMARNLHSAGNRDLRMRTQRLNYFLRAMLDAGANTASNELIISETRLQGSKTWDFFRSDDGEWWLSSDDKKIRFRNSNGQQRYWNLGLPTQIDPLPGDLISFGSLYTEGAMLWQNDEWRKIEHSRPILLVFDHASRRYLLDHDGRVWLDEPRRWLFDSIRPQVHFARYFDGRLYLLDNSDFGYITILDLDTGQDLRQAVLPVQVCNDLVKVDEDHYLIDKQQGSVFKFDRDWNFVERALGFGRGPGCLLDPVAIRRDDDRLLIVSWLSARLTELRIF